MRAFLFDNAALPQDKFMNYDLTLMDVAVFYQLYKFFSSGQSIYITENVFEEDEDGGVIESKIPYYYITYNKLITDLPILRIKERQIRNVISKLESIGLVKRFKFEKPVINSKGKTILPQTKVLYINVNIQKLYEQPLKVVEGKDESLKNFITNKEINMKFVPKIQYKDFVYIYNNPGINFDVLQLDNIKDLMQNGIMINLKSLLSEFAIYYYRAMKAKIINKNTIKLEIADASTAYIESYIYKIEQAIVDTYKYIFTNQQKFKIN